MDAQQAPQPQLLDIHLAGEPSIWPLAIGWWIVIAVALLLLTWFFIKLRQYQKLKKHQRAILAQFEDIENQLKNNPSSASIAETNIFLRQLAVQYYPQEETASLTGKAWLQFLDQSGSTTQFTKGAGEILIKVPYKNTETKIQDDFLPLIQRWIKIIIKSRRGLR